MGRFAIIRRLWRNRDLLLKFLDLLKQIRKTAETLADIRNALAEGIEEGQLDSALDRFTAANKRAEDFKKTGR